MCPPESLVIETLPDLSPGAGEVVIDVKAAGVNFPDVLIIQNKYQFKPELPFTPGSEVAGVVNAVGDGVSHVKAGDHVIAPHPAYQQLYEVPQAIGCEVSLWRVGPETGYRYDVDALERALDRDQFGVATSGGEVLGPDQVCRRRGAGADLSVRRVVEAGLARDGFGEALHFDHVARHGGRLGG